MKIAILDDYQRVARDLADWSRLPAGSELTVFDRHLAEEERVAALQPFEVLVTQENYAVFYRDALEDILAWKAGAPVRVLT
jgi:hypothetical protein